MAYLPAIYSQMDGSSYAAANCGPAVCTELLDMASCGAVRIPAPKIRRESGDTYGGIEGGLLASTVNRLTNHLYPFTYLRYTDWSMVRAALEHASIGLIIDAGKTVRTKYRTNNFTGNHWLTIAGGTIRDGTVKYEDPGTTTAGWNRIPLHLLREASDFGGNHWVLLTPVTVDTQKTATRRTAVRAEPDRTAKRLAGLTKGDTIHVRRSTKGGPWRRDDGTTAHGWWVVEYKGGKAFVKGESLR